MAKQEKKVDIKKLRDQTKDRETSEATVKPKTGFRSILTIVK